MSTNAQKPKETAIETVRAVLMKAGLEPQPMQDAPGFTVGFKGDGPPVVGHALVLEEDGIFLFYLELLDRAPQESRGAVAEFLMRANYGLNVGNFELDYSNGGVRYKSSLDYAGATLPGIFVRNAILAAMNTVETYATALKDVMSGSKSAVMALADAEASMEDE